MWPDVFDPENLNPDASLNKLVIGPVSGAQPAHVGANGGDLLGRDAIVRLVQHRCGVVVRHDAVSDWLVAAMEADPSGGPAAVVEEMGDRLASLVATLRDPGSAESATGGRRTYLEVWQNLDLVILGGGLMKGAVGERVAARAGAVLATGRAAAPAVRVALYPVWLPLLGAARSARGNESLVIVLDCGQTSLKRGVALIRGERLVSVRVFASLPVTAVRASDLPLFVALAVRELRKHHVGTASQVVVSVASYIDNGRSVPDPGSIYEQLDPAVMQSRFGIPLHLMHDGSAAWRGLGADAPSAVIMLGTWLGVGIGPHRARLRRYAADFRIHPDGPGD